MNGKRGQAALSELVSGWSNFIIFFIAFSLMVLIVGTILFNFYESGAVRDKLPNGELNPIMQFAKNYPTYFDWIPLVVYVVLLVGSVAIARVVPFEISYIIFFMLLFVVLAVATMFAANLVYYLVDLAAFADIRDQFVIIPIMAQGYLFFGMAYMAIVYGALLTRGQ